MSQSAAQAVRFFRLNGFVALRGFFTEVEIARLARVARAHSTTSQRRSQVGATHHGSSFERTYDLWRESDVARSIAFDPGLARICAEMIGCDAVRIIADDVFNKRPGDRVSNWHADRPFVPIDNDRVLTVWIPLVDVTHDMGSMRYVAGSHERRYLAPRRPFTGQIRGHLWYATQIALRRERVASLEARPGDVLIHHGNTLHMAGANTADRARIAYGVHFVDARSRFVAPANEQQRAHVDAAAWHDLRPGDEIETASSPVAYAGGGDPPTRA